jgi:hypothetical protein
MFDGGDLPVRVYLPVPGIDQNAVNAIKEQAESRAACSPSCSLFSGGALTQFALFALGIMPYITASIIMQILGVVIPKLQQWQEQGAVGQRKITQWTRYLGDRRSRSCSRPASPSCSTTAAAACQFRQHRPRPNFGRSGCCSSCRRSPPARPC